MSWLDNAAFWRRWHRWIGFVATIFLLFASVTGFLVAFTEFFGEEEARREATRDLVSPVTIGAPSDLYNERIERALALVAQRAPGAPVDEIRMAFKGEPATVTIYVGKPDGGEDRRFVVNAMTGALISEDAYVDKPFLNRLHSGEAFGDGGLVVAMIWGLALAFLAVSGLSIYLTMRRRNPVGVQKVFW